MHPVPCTLAYTPTSGFIGPGRKNVAGSAGHRRVLTGLTDLVRHLACLLAEPAAAAGSQCVGRARRLGGAAEDTRYLIRDGAGDATRLLAQLAVAAAVRPRHHRLAAAGGRLFRALEGLRHLVCRRVQDVHRGLAEVAVPLLVGAGRQRVRDAGAVVRRGTGVAGAEAHGAGVVGLERLLHRVDDVLIA
ncbi:hypothetical protein PG994_001469 [Apiospora phragmitis]|uniref:Uncharacterized protein n=1 Tax=Apiospora phragmitis TaxID=2905665 RepID=A0ABR1WTN4_9PEZI